MKYALPESVKIGGLAYSVEINDDYLRGAETLSAASHQCLEIRLAAGPPTARQKVQESLLYELVHIVGQVYGAGEDLPESWVHAITNGMFQVLRDNPLATNFILGEDSNDGVDAQDDDEPGCIETLEDLKGLDIPKIIGGRL